MNRFSCSCTLSTTDDANSKKYNDKKEKVEELKIEKPTTPTIKTTTNTYTRKELLGEGGFAKVYRV